MDEAYVPGTVRWLMVVTVAMTILVAAVIRPDQGVGRPGPFGLFTYDLWLHAGAYWVFQLTVIFALVGGAKPPVVSVTFTPLFVVAYGCLLEGIQLWLAYRSFSGADMVANTVGSLVAIAGYLLGRALVTREPGLG